MFLQLAPLYILRTNTVYVLNDVKALKQEDAHKFPTLYSCGWLDTIIWRRTKKICSCKIIRCLLDRNEYLLAEMVFDVVPLINIRHSFSYRCAIHIYIYMLWANTVTLTHCLLWTKLIRITTKFYVKLKYVAIYILIIGELSIQLYVYVSIITYGTINAVVRLTEPNKMVQMQKK